MSNSRKREDDSKYNKVEELLNGLDEIPEPEIKITDNVINIQTNSGGRVYGSNMDDETTS